MGHAFQQTLMDALIRYHRMRGYNTLWVPGTDHAGIATQIVVERQLAGSRARSRHDLGREKFVERVWEWKAAVGLDHHAPDAPPGRLATGRDWAAASYFTMDARTVARRGRDLRAAVRGRPDLPRQAPGQLGPGARTAVSDLEVESEEEDGTLWHIRYPLRGRQRRIAAWSRRRGPRRCSATSRWRCIRTTSATAHLVGKRVGCRSPTARSRSSPTTTSTANSAPAA